MSVSQRWLVVLVFSVLAGAWAYHHIAAAPAWLRVQSLRSGFSTSTRTIYKIAVRAEGLDGFSYVGATCDDAKCRFLGTSRVYRVEPGDSIEFLVGVSREAGPTTVLIEGAYPGGRFSAPVLIEHQVGS